MFGLFDWIKLGAALVVGALAGGTIFYAVGHWRGHEAGYDQRIAETAAATAKAELERKVDDALLQSMPDYELCLAGLGADSVHVDACEQLRGLGQE